MSTHAANSQSHCSITFDGLDEKEESLNYCQTRKVNKLTTEQHDAIIERKQIKDETRFFFISFHRHGANT